VGDNTRESGQFFYVRKKIADEGQDHCTVILTARPGCPSNAFSYLAACSAWATGGTLDSQSEFLLAEGDLDQGSRSLLACGEGDVVVRSRVNFHDASTSGNDFF
jgi:hypothetical protein